MDAAEQRRLGGRGLRVSQLGCGSAALGNLYREVSETDAEETIAASFAAGIRYFDTAPRYGYGLSERRLGHALRERVRGKYVLSTKVGRLLRPRTGPPDPDDPFPGAPPLVEIFDYSRDGVLRSLDESLGRLGVERVDVALLHDIGRLTHGDAHEGVFATAMDGGYRALDELRAQGRIAAVGLGVNEWQICLQAMDHGDFDCFLIAGRYTLLDQSALEQLLPVCQTRGISVVVGGPFNSGILASEPTQDAKYDYEVASPEVLCRARSLFRVCQSHGVPLPAAALQFPLLHPAVASVIPGARSAREVEENVAHLERVIPDGLWDDLRAEGLIHPDAPIRASASAREPM